MVMKCSIFKALKTQEGLLSKKENTRRAYVFENSDPKFDMYNALLKANHLLGAL